MLTGSARARIVRPNGTPERGFVSEDLTLASGNRLALDYSAEALQVHAVARTLVVLRLQRTAENPRPTRSHALAGGALLHQAAGDIRASLHELMLAMLGRMQRREAAPVMAAMAREPDPSLRWQGRRERPRPKAPADRAPAKRELRPVPRMPTCWPRPLGPCARN